MTKHYRMTWKETGSCLGLLLFMVACYILSMYIKARMWHDFYERF
jgi:uncharacterized membrane-anchored protein YjiN (DUF445 family)